MLILMTLQSYRRDGQSRWSSGFFIGYIVDNMGLNVVGIISLNLAIALSGRHLENEFFITVQNSS